MCVTLHLCFVSVHLLLHIVLIICIVFVFCVVFHMKKICIHIFLFAFILVHLHLFCAFVLVFLSCVCYYYIRNIFLAKAFRFNSYTPQYTFLLHFVLRFTFLFILRITFSGLHLF